MGLLRVLLKAESGANPDLRSPDEQAEYQLRDRLSFMRFAGLSLHEAVPDAKTIWLYREQRTRAGALARVFPRFDAMLAERGYLAMGGQIIDATVVEARRPRLTKEEKASLRDGGTPEGWSKARERQIDRDGRWTIKRGRKPAPEGGAQRQASLVAHVFATALNLIPCFTPIRSPESNGVCEAFVKIFKRDYVRVNPRPDAISVL